MGQSPRFQMRVHAGHQDTIADSISYRRQSLTLAAPARVSHTDRTIPPYFLAAASSSAIAMACLDAFRGAAVAPAMRLDLVGAQVGSEMALSPARVVDGQPAHRAPRRDTRPSAPRRRRAHVVTGNEVGRCGGTVPGYVQGRLPGGGRLDCAVRFQGHARPFPLLCGRCQLHVAMRAAITGSGYPAKIRGRRPHYGLERMQWQ